MDKLSVLVVDDEPLIRELFKAVLDREQSASTCFASSFKEAINVIKKQPFDIVFLDIALKDGNGLELYFNVKHYQRNASIIMVSGYGGGALIGRDLSEGLIWKCCKAEELDTFLDLQIKTNGGFNFAFLSDKDLFNKEITLYADKRDNLNAFVNIAENDVARFLNKQPLDMVIVEETFSSRLPLNFYNIVSKQKAGLIILISEQFSKNLEYFVDMLPKPFNLEHIENFINEVKKRKGLNIN